MAALLTRAVLAAVCTGTPRALFSALAGLPGAALPGLAGPRSLLLPRSLQLPLLPAQGFKNKAVLRKRCRDCYMVKRKGRWYVLCKTNPRHKQRQIV